MMRADYDSKGDTIQIELERVEKLGHGEEVENGAVVVGIYEDRPVMVDVIGTQPGFEQALRIAAQRYDLDAEALAAAARAAVAAPNRPVILDVGVRAAA
ncbi:MAG TPA: hypothetical protein VIY71_10240 [Solirubrobacterales bacterium]